MDHKQKQSIIVATALLAWGSAIAAGLVSVHRYENTPGRFDIAHRRWPAESALRFSSERFNVVMLAHPRCPCTRASLDELAQLLSHCEVPMTAHILFWTPSDAGHEWQQTELWKMALAIPDVQAHVDENGDEARRFGATTSGHVIVFQGDGTRIFSGGLTKARGKAGNGNTASAINNLIKQKTSLSTDLPVFGCPLFDSQTHCNEGVRSCLK